MAYMYNYVVLGCEVKRCDFIITKLIEIVNTFTVLSDLEANISSNTMVIGIPIVFTDENNFLDSTSIELTTLLTTKALLESKLEKMGIEPSGKIKIWAGKRYV